MAVELTSDDPAQLEADGRLLEAIDLYTERNRRERDPVVEKRLVALRHRAVQLLAERPGRQPWPPPTDDRFDGAGLPEVRRGAIGGDDIASAVLRHGCLVVRDLLTPTQVDRMVIDIDRAVAAYAEHQPGGARSPWFAPFNPEGHNVGFTRKFVADAGGIWLGDSPPALFDLFEVLRESGVLDAIEEYLGERPAISLEKSTMRCTPFHDRISSWHQDGSFIDDGIRTVNVWTALTDCGGDDDTTPALDIVPRRLEEVLDTGATVAHAVPWATIDALAEETPVIRPAFKAGDALLFDELFLHRTGVSPGMSRPRYAIESWFFAPSCYPANYVPLVC